MNVDLLARAASLPLLLALTAGCREQGGSPDAFSTLPIRAATEQAAREQKLLLLDFVAAWCGPCKQLDETTWRDAEVVAWLREHAVAIKIDVDEHPQLASEHSIHSLPTILLLRPDGSVLDRLVGYRGPAEFLTAVRSAMGGKDSLARAREASEHSGSRDPMQRMQLARELAERGKHAEALREYLWCFDHGADASRAFVGVRLSFLLMEIEQLGQKYAPALQALRERRDAAAAADFQADPLRSMDLTALNRVLGEREGNLALFDRLVQQPDPGPAIRLLADEVRDQLLAQRRYGDLLKAAGELDDQWQTDQMLLAQASEQASGEARAVAQEAVRKHLLAKWLGYYEALLATGQQDAASELAGRLRGQRDLPELETMLASRGKRARQQ